MSRKANGQAALGFRARTGFAALVALAGPLSAPRVIAREQIGLQDPRVPRFVYHAAEEAGNAKAAKIVSEARERILTLAKKSIAAVVKRLRAEGHDPRKGAVTVGANPMPHELEKILAAHTLIHAAEGVFYREILLAACEACKVNPLRVVEREAWSRAAKTLRKSEHALRATVQSWGKILGPPWGEDQKLACLAAWLALSS